MKPSLRHLFHALLVAFLLLSGVGCRPPRAETGPGDVVTLKVLVTSDVHGWINPSVQRKAERFEGGLGNIANAWRDREGYDPAGGDTGEDLLVLDGGDMWTGPPESTLAQGAPMIEAYRALRYDAAAVGNHEFDFGVETLRAHARALNFPLLSANLERTPEGPALDFSQASTLLTVKGIPVGIIGLSTISTPRTTFPTRVEGLRFEDYLAAVRTQAKSLMDRGARVLIVLAHEGIDHLKPVAEATSDLPIRLFLGGHIHRPELAVLSRDKRTPADDVVLLNPGHYGRSYGRLELVFVGEELVAHTETIVPVGGPIETMPALHPVLGPIGEKASEAVKARLSEVVGQAAAPMEVGNVDHSPLGQLIADSWLEMFPQAELAITNIGGVRQPLQAGPITLGDLFGVLPFQNDLVMVRLTPADLREALKSRHGVPGGFRFRYRLEDGSRVVTHLEDLNGKPLEEGRRYSVIITDFLHAGGDGMPFKRMDPEPVALGVSWRDPVIALFRRHGEKGVVPPAGARAVAQ